MAYSYVLLSGDGVNTNFTFNFGYLSRSHIHVSVDGVEVPYTFLSDFTVKVEPAPGIGAKVEIRRKTPLDEPIVDWTDGTVLTEADLDLNTLFSLYAAQEAQDLGASAITQDSEGVFDGQGRSTTNFADPTDDTGLVTKHYFDSVYSPQLDAKVQAAANSASQAGGYAAAADASADLAAQLLGLFQGQYLGPQASPPTVDGNGNPVTEGDLYFDTTDKVLRIYTGVEWQNAASAIEGYISKPSAPYVATGGETSVPVPGGYDPNFIIVFLNGMSVSPPDIDISSGSSIDFTQPLVASDEVYWVAFGTFTLADLNAHQIAYESGTVKEALDAHEQDISDLEDDLSNLDSTEVAHGGGTVKDALDAYGQDISDLEDDLTNLDSTEVAHGGGTVKDALDAHEQDISDLEDDLTNLNSTEVAHGGGSVKDALDGLDSRLDNLDSTEVAHGGGTVSGALGDLEDRLDNLDATEVNYDGGTVAEALDELMSGDDCVCVPPLTRAEAALFEFDPSVTGFQTTGYNAAGDGGAALFKRVSSGPASPNRFQSADGAWWEMVDEFPNVAAYGASPSASGATNAAAFQAAVNALPAAGGTILIPNAGNYTVTTASLNVGTKRVTWVANKGATVNGSPYPNIRGTWTNLPEELFFDNGGTNGVFTFGKALRHYRIAGGTGHIEAYHIETDVGAYGHAGEMIVGLNAVAKTNSSGHAFGLNGYSWIEAGAASTAESCALEANTDVRKTGGITRKVGIQIVDVNTSVGSATFIDTAIWIGTQTGGVGYSCGVQFGVGSDPTAFPIIAGGTLISTQNGRQLAYGLDLAGIPSFTGSAIRVPTGSNALVFGPSGGGGIIRSDTTTGGPTLIFEAHAGIPLVRSSGRIAAEGYRCRAGTTGAYGGNYFNLHWNGSAMELWVDNVKVGTINTTP